MTSLFKGTLQKKDFCLLVSTGTAQHNDGTLQVMVNGENVSPGSDTKVYIKGEVVVDECFTSMDKIQIRNPTSNAWTGSIVASANGRGSYDPLDCLNCLPGASILTESIVVDGNGDATQQAETACMNGATCDLTFFSGLYDKTQIIPSHLPRQYPIIYTCIVIVICFQVMKLNLTQFGR